MCSDRQLCNIFPSLQVAPVLVERRVMGDEEVRKSRRVLDQKLVLGFLVTALSLTQGILAWWFALLVGTMSLFVRRVIKVMTMKY